MYCISDIVFNLMWSTVVYIDVNVVRNILLNKIVTNVEFYMVTVLISLIDCETCGFCFFPLCKFRSCIIYLCYELSVRNIFCCGLFFWLWPRVSVYSMCEFVWSLYVCAHPSYNIIYKLYVNCTVSTRFDRYYISYGSDISLHVRRRHHK